MPALPRPLAALGHRRYRWLFISNLGFFFALSGQGVVRAWITYDLTQSELALGAVSFAVALPMLIVAPFGGVVADVVDRRRAIMAGQMVIVGTEVTIWALIFTGAIQYWHLLVGSVVMGCVFPVIMPARQALSTSIVGRSMIGNATALSTSGMNLTRVVGPPLSAMILGFWGPVAAYGLGVALYGLAFLAMIPVGAAPPPPRAPGRVQVFRQIAEAVQYLRGDRTVLALLFFGLVPMFLAMPFQTLLVVFAEDVWRTGPSGLGILSGAAGVGGVLGSVYVAWSAVSPRFGPMIKSLLLFCCLLAGFALSPWFLVAVPLVLLANVLVSVFGTLNNTAIQLLIPDEVRGRVSSILLMAFSLPLLGTLPMSAVAEVYGPRAAVVGAALAALSIALGFAFLFPALRATDEKVREALRGL